MATMEKTKRESSKKSRSKKKSVVVVSNEEEQESDKDKDDTKASAAKLVEIPEILCAKVHENISQTDDSPNVENMEIKSETVDEDEEASKEEPKSEEGTPTAPPADDGTLELNQSPPIVVQYPNIQLQLVETRSEVLHHTKRQSKPQFLLDTKQGMLKPLTEEQLRQLYYCAEAELVNQFELEFLMNSLLETYAEDLLDIFLQEYYELQSKLSMMKHDLETCRAEGQQAMDKIWIKVPIKKSFTGRCADGTMVTESVTYDIMQVDGKALQISSDRLQQLFDLVCYRYTKYSIASHIAKVKITNIIDKIIMQPPLVAYAQQSKTLKLNKSLDNEILNCVSHVRRAISIVFTYVRKLSPSREFTSDLRAWLSKLVSVHIRIATKEDHWFLLFNLLRCPSGVGNWAAPLLQVPCSNVETTSTSNQSPLPLNCEELNHCIAVLQILLLPIKKRNEYLQAHKEILDPVKEDCWTLVDSDGEDSHTSTGDLNCLRENDLIAFFSQIPFEQLFMSALNVEKFLGDYIIQGDCLTSQHILRMIAFFSKLIGIFGEGMVTYNQERYKQFAKRLGRLLRHTLHYATDLNELFIQNKMAKDEATCERIALELNVLLLRACHYIYCTRKLATWQYFASLPFSSLSKQTLWQIFYFLNIGFPAEYPTQPQDYAELLAADDFWVKFNVANADSSPEDLYYLLQAFFEMANECDKHKDWEFIRTICLQIFNIGFINVKTREICYKASRDMLVNLTLSYPELMSCLLVQMKIRFADIENASYLWKALPLDIWQPAIESFDLLSNWLLHYDFRTAESLLARLIVSHLNWGFDESGQRLFLPHNIHVRMACLISEALNKQAPEVIGIASFTDGVRQVTQLLDYSETTVEQFSTWCWSMTSMLRLHLMDQSPESVKNTLQNPSEALMYVHDLERIDLIYQGVTENRPLAIYVALLISLHGHSIPLICQKGFDLLKQLLNDNRHAAVIRVLELIVPLFLTTPETLANCEGFQSIVLNLLYADKTYMKMAKSALYAESVGPVLQLLDNMIHHQITKYINYGLRSPLDLINVWLNCLTSLPNWPNSGVLHLLDRVLSVAYQFPDAQPQAVEFFKNYYKDCNEWKGNNKKSALKTLFGTSCARIPQLSPDQPWLAAVLLDIEFQTQDALIWPELLRQLAANDNRNPLEAVLKTTLATVKIPHYQASMLVLYKYATFISNMNVNNALFPIMNQKFFELYLHRVPIDYNDDRFTTTYGVSEKFYEFNVPLMKKVKSKLKAAESYYANEVLKMNDDEALTYFYGSCAKMMNTYALWLEETNINKFSKDDLNFPPQYNVKKLKEILNGNTSHWTEFIYLRDIRNEQIRQANEWARRCLRMQSVKRQRTPPQSKISSSTPMQRIKTQLASYDKIQAAPVYKPYKLNTINEINMKTFKGIKDMLAVLNASAKKFNLQSCELSSLVRNYLDLVPQLYTMQSYTKTITKNCSWVLQNCKGPAMIEATLEEVKVNYNIQEKLANYNTRHDKIIDGMIDQRLDELVRCHQQLTEIVNLLLVKHAAAPNAEQIVTTTGINFFYEIVNSVNDITLRFPTTMEFYTQILQDLGIFVQANQHSEGLNILKLALKRPDLAKTLYGVFMPSTTSAQYFIPMYEFLIDSYLQRCDTKILFVLLSKFELNTWLEQFKPKLNEINQVLLLVLRGLECWSKSEASLLQDQFRRHLVHIFNYDFPQHYGEVMQLLLDRISDQKLMPDVLLDTLNALLVRFNCTALTLDTKDDEVLKTAVEFSRRQNLFNLQASTDTCLMFARHFQKERLQHGLHGLYPKHKDYCTPLAMWFTCIGHVVVTMAIYSYQDLLANQISDIVFGYIMDMYAPWLIPYTEKNLPQETSNWMRQLREQGQILLPWSEQYASNSKVLIRPLISTLNFVLEHLPTSDRILDHTFSWYVHHFAIVNMEKYIHVPIQEGIATLAWERFRPQLQYIDMLYDSLQKFIPECHAMLSHIFIRINWNAWFAEILPTIHTTALQVHAMSRLFNIFIKIAFEPNIHMHINLSRILEDAMQYPWHMVSYEELEQVFKWFVSTVDPCIILKMPLETNYADRAVLDLLQLVSGVRAEQPFPQSTSHATAKRILYVRSYVQLLRLCAVKNQKLISSKDGAKHYNAVVLELLRNLDRTLKTLALTQTHDECRREALNLLIEIIVPMQTQSEQTSNLHIEAIVSWQQECSAGNVLLVACLNAIGHMKGFIAGIYSLLESTISNYFRTSEECRTTHTPNWSNLMRELHMSLDRLELMPCILGAHLHTLHIFIIYHLDKINNVGDQITFLQNLCQLIEPIKTNPQTEARMVIVWGLMISRGSKILLESPLVKKPLLMLARNLHVLSSESEGWGESLLGAIGLMREKVTNKRRILTRCLACVIFSLFPNINSSNELLPNQEFKSALHELSMLLANKKFLEYKPLLVQAIGIVSDNRTPSFSDVPHLVARLIGLFYHNDFLTTIPEVWDFEFALT